MALLLGVDIGTTTVTALALDAGTGDIAACRTLENDAETTAPAEKARGRSEWDPGRILAQVHEALRGVAEELGERRADLAGLCLTGQQHGVLLVDAGGRPVTPFVNWQDRRAEEAMPGGNETYLARARALVGPDAPARAGCALSAGFLGVTLYWLRAQGLLPADTTACFIMDWVAASLAGVRPATDPTNAASSGLLDVARRAWDEEMLAALALPRSLFPEVREAGDRLGPLTAEAARATGLPAGLPVFVGLGDNQASFLGSVAECGRSVLVNIGTGGQVSAYTDRFVYAPPAETRPFPRHGYLLVHAGLNGGRAYALLEGFFRQVVGDFGVPPAAGAPDPGVRLYERMNALAASAPPGAGGIRCDPCFAGSRADPDRRASWTGISAENFTPANMTRALLEGMARGFHDGYAAINAATGASAEILVGAGNGVRRNPVLSQILSEQFGLPLVVPRHREEAACGAALIAAVGSGGQY